MQNIPKESWSGIFTLAGAIIGALIGFGSSFWQNKARFKKEKKNEIMAIYRMAMDAICHYLDVVQEEINITTSYNERLDWKRREREARVHHYKSVAYLRMLGEDDIADDTKKFFEFIASQDRQRLNETWDIMLKEKAYPLIDKLETRARKL